ncbi:glycoside hydrolase family 3 C-terminal domain-containing protein [Evansella halocellulosilytica]|uniref:glycoside hydrolase family 3 C-terminal domain-containing protein n=1 Tax=Evansella halocellulosilytica TaxID=2011013 RepID=UPI000BB729FD|nr:glycoside hydrolase family 3 C-terminal domain-containing protein [Evansella halocellulosilytica]
MKKLAVIGPNANSVYNLLGDYTATQKDGKVTTVLHAIQQQAPKEMTIAYTKGCGILDESKDGFSEALELANHSDAVLLVLGGSSSRNFNIQFDHNGAAILGDQPVDMDCGEGVDVADLKLGGVQNELINEIATLGKPMIGVVVQGRPYAIRNLVDACQSVLCCWYPGEEGGKAIADVLFGKINPSGKLPVSIPRSSNQLPVYYNKKDMGQKLDYQDLDSSPLYPFGFGLSYTTFNFSNINLSKEFISIADLENGEKVSIDVTVENNGEYPGAEVIQLYRYDKESSITKRVRELKKFKKIYLEPGEKKTITFSIGKEDMCIWNKEMGDCLEPKTIYWYIGNDSTATYKVSTTLIE